MKYTEFTFNGMKLRANIDWSKADESIEFNSLEAIYRGEWREAMFLTTGNLFFNDRLMIAAYDAGIKQHELENAP